MPIVGNCKQYQSYLTPFTQLHLQISGKSLTLLCHFAPSSLYLKVENVQNPVRKHFDENNRVSLHLT